MFPKPNRLLHEAFTRVFRIGRRFNNENISIIVAPNTLVICHFAVQVGVKIDKRATQRNRMKRLIREAIRKLLPDIKNGFDIVIIAQKNFSEKKEQEIEAVLLDLFRKNNLFYSQSNTSG